MSQTSVQPAPIPSSASLSHLRARDRAGWAVMCAALAISASGLWLSLGESFWLWVLGQGVLALALLQWFVILHEAGHNALFRTRRLNRLAGHVAGVFALIPFFNWQRIHARHHKYTGWQDLILLSQHTHMPSNLSHGAPVRPFPPQQQEQFTRSLRLPEWRSLFLLRFDMHEHHHMYVQVPGYDLHRIPYTAQNEVDWLDWTRGAKQLSGTAFLFGSRKQTGFRR